VFSAIRSRAVGAMGGICQNRRLHMQNEIVYKLIEQPDPLTAVELSRLPLSQMNCKVDQQEADYKRRYSVENDEACMLVINMMKLGAVLKAKLNEKRNHYFIDDERIDSKIFYKLEEKGFIRGH
jgi:uncharacterized protein YfbU (UPF0304 family)